MDDNKKMQKFLLRLLVFEVFTEVLGGVFGLSELRSLGRYLVSGALMGCVMVWVYCSPSISYVAMWLLNLGLGAGLVWGLYQIGHVIGIALLTVLVAYSVLFFRVTDIAGFFIVILNVLYAKFETDGDEIAYIEGLEECRSFPGSNRLPVYVQVLDKRILLKDFLLVYEIYSLQGEAHSERRGVLWVQAERRLSASQVSTLLAVLHNAKEVKDEIDAAYPTSKLTWEQMLTIAVRGRKESIFISPDAQVMICARCGGQGVAVENGQKVGICPVCQGVGYCKIDGKPFTKRERTKAVWKNFVLPVLLLLLGIIGAIGCLELTIFSGRFQALLLYPNGTASELLHAYANWYPLEICMVIVGLVICVLPLGIIKYVLKLQKAIRKQLFYIFVLFSGLYILLVAAMLADHQTPLLYLQVKEDIAQMENGQLETVTVWLSPKIRPCALPPYDKNMPKSLTRYGGIGDETEGEWVKFYVPNSLGFSLEQDALYEEKETIEWNIEHAVQYEVTYTQNFHVVTEIYPVK